MIGGPLSGAAAFTRVKRKRRGGNTANGASGPGVFLSNSTIADTAAVGDLVGNLSVLGGSGSYTFVLSSNPGGLFSIVGSALKVAAALAAGPHLITVQADNGAGSTPSSPFSIVVTHTAAALVPTFELLGF